MLAQGVLQRVCNAYRQMHRGDIMADKYLTLKEAAEALGKSVDTIRRRIKAGQIPAEKYPGVYGEEWRIKESDLTGDDAQEIREIIPVKREISADEFLSVLEGVVQDSMQRAMQDQAEEIRQLREEIHDLREALKLLPDIKKRSWWQFWK